PAQSRRWTGPAGRHGPPPSRPGGCPVPAAGPPGRGTPPAGTAALPRQPTLLLPPPGLSGSLPPWWGRVGGGGLGLAWRPPHPGPAPRKGEGKVQKGPVFLAALNEGVDRGRGGRNGPRRGSASPAPRRPGRAVPTLPGLRPGRARRTGWRGERL